MKLAADIFAVAEEHTPVSHQLLVLLIKDEPAGVTLIMLLDRLPQMRRVFRLETIQLFTHLFA